MPQISKIRIVNFYYNDGNRFIPDELYDLTSASGDALSSLFQLINAGGKTVMVQLIMQPVNPRAMAGGRHIEDYFVNQGAHSFVVLEWTTDGSREKLLTGIAMAASTSNSSDDNKRGNSIKYYTFKTVYDRSSPYDIAALELSKNEGGRYVPLPFEYVREKAKASKGALEYYSSDDSVKWTEELSHYGILRSEWETVIETLNKDEGGLDKYFDEAKTSDKLISKFFIPAIEQKMKKGANSMADSSLETMLINYAKKIADKESVIQERDTNKRLLATLTELNDMSDQLYSKNDEYIACISEACGFKTAVTKGISFYESEMIRLDSEIEKQKELIKHINYEEKSKAYYVASDNYEQQAAQYNEAKEKLEKNREEFNRLKHEEDLLQCAKLYKKIKEYNGEADALKSMIEEKENDSQDAERIAMLKYSVLLKAQEEAAILDRKNQEIINDLTDKNAELEKAKADNKRQEEIFEAANRKYIETETVLVETKKATDRLVEKLAMDVNRQFDGFYHKDELEGKRENRLKEQKQLSGDLEQLQTLLDKLEKRRTKLPEEHADLKIEIANEETRKNQALSELGTFEKLYEKLVKICTKFSFDETSIYTDQLKRAVKDEYESTQARINKLSQYKKDLDEKLAAVKNGYLHILPQIIKYAESTGVIYRTCEEYLCSAIDEKNITREAAEKLLDTYPEVAYSILFDNKSEINRFLAAGNLEWLPAIVPLLTMEQFDLILKGEMEHTDFLAVCDKGYFSNRTDYSKKIENEIKDLENKIEQKRQYLADCEKEKKLVEQFDYSDSWKREQDVFIEKIENSIREMREKQSELERESVKLQAEYDENKEQFKSYDENLRNINHWLDLFAELSMRMEDEISEYNKEQEAFISCNNADKERKKSADKVRVLEEKIERLNVDQSNISKQMKNIQEIISKVDNAKSTKVVEGALEELYSKYQTLSDNMLKHLEELQLKLLYIQNEKEENNQELSTYSECSLEEYKNILFSVDYLEKVKANKDIAQNKLDIQQKIYDECNNSYIESRTKLRYAEYDLEEFGKVALAQNDIGEEFRRRRKTANDEILILGDKKKSVDKEKNRLERITDQIELTLEGTNKYENINKIVELSDDPEKQWENIKKYLLENKKAFNKMKDMLCNKIMGAVNEFKDITIAEIVGRLKDVKGMLDDAGIKGDRFFTVSESIGTMITSIEKMNSQIETDLREIENDFNDIVNQCMNQGKRMYQDLRIIAGSSKADIIPGKGQTQMVKLDLPEEKEISEEASRIAIRTEIESGANEIRNLLKNAVEEKEIQKRAKRIVSSQRLLLRYIKQESIQVRVCKIDTNIKNYVYKRWEDTLTQNSGSQKLVVFFAVVLTLMNYTRTKAGLSNKNAKSVLILDNPFGKISSAPLLRPMFDIAKRFNVQLICFSDINNSDVVNCFDCVIKLRIKAQNLSNFEIMTHEENERIEHGYYKFINKQLSLF